MNTGFSNVSVREICESAAITPPTLHYHFGDKDGLFAAVVRETITWDQFLFLLRQAVAVPSCAQAKLRAYTRTYLNGFPTDFLNPGLHLQHSTQLSDTSLRQLRVGLSHMHQLSKDLLEEGIEAGELREVDVDRAASCLMGTADSFVQARIYLGAEYGIEEVTDYIVDLVAHGLASTA